MSLLLACSSASSSGCIDGDAPAHPLERDEPRCNIINAQGEVLWYQTTVADAERLADERRADVAQFPKWQGALTLLMIEAWVKPEAVFPPARDAYPPPFPAELQRDPAPALIYRGGQIGLGDDHPLVAVQCGAWFGDIRIEEALFNIDRFTASCRARILATLPLQYDMGAAS